MIHYTYYINKVIQFLKSVFFISLLLLVILSLYPGSIIGFFLYGDLGKQPNLINNPFGTTINHFFSYLYISLLGFLVYLKTENFPKMVFILFFLSITLELLQLIVPNRTFQLGDLVGNTLGVFVAYFIIKIYLLIQKS
tara:strand:- start:2456 stop:2869 length:414 start_codon:yes stop_codon:yes gene_type:complete